MNKKEAIEKFVAELNAIPRDWVEIIAENKGEYLGLPMWGTLWIMDYFGEKLYENARIMMGGKDELLDEINQKENSNYNESEREILKKAIDGDDWSTLEEYIDEEMSGCRNVLDKDGNTTAMFIYELDGQYLIGVNGAGWNFYDGVWDKLYDVCGLQWHDKE